MGGPNWQASQLSKTIHTEQHKKLRLLLKTERKNAGLTQTGPTPIWWMVDVLGSGYSI
jgi:hypothetical protein